MQPYLHHAALKRKRIARIRKKKKPDYIYADHATLLPLGARACVAKSAQALRISKPKGQLNPSNVHTNTTLVLLLLQAKTVRATYKRYWESKENIKPQKFEWKSLEGDGDACERQENLLRYIEQHLSLIRFYENQIRLSESASKGLAQASRSGGPRHRSWMALNKAIAAELLRREDEAVHSAQADNRPSAQAQSNPNALKYPAQFALGIIRINKECLAEDLDVRKLTVKNKLKAAVINTYQSNNLVQAKRAQDQLDRKLALERVKHHAKKARKRLIKQYRAQMDTRPR